MKWFKPFLLTIAFVILLIVGFTAHYYVKGFKNTHAVKLPIVNSHSERIRTKAKNLIPALKNGNFNAYIYQTTVIHLNIIARLFYLLRNTFFNFLINIP